MCDPSVCDMSPARRHNKKCSGLTEVGVQEVGSIIFLTRPSVGRGQPHTQDQAGAWQLISVSVNRQCSSDIWVIAEKLHEPARRVLGMSLTWSCLGYACYGLATLMVSDQFFKIKGSWRFEERCTAVLFGTTLVMAVYAVDFGEDSGVYETFMSNVTKVLREGRRGRWQRIPHDMRSQCGDGIFCVQMEKTSRSSMGCMVPCAGKGTKTIMAFSRS